MKYTKSLKRNSKKRKTLRRKTLRRKTRKVVYDAPKENLRILAKRVINTYTYRPKK
jgi:hypothetical protein